MKDNRYRFAVKHIAKSLQATTKPKLAKEALSISYIELL